MEPGTQLGPYELLEFIGAGGMGEVWKARDTRLMRIVAIKRLNAQHSARFKQEARAIAALNHPHICQVHDVGQITWFLSTLKVSRSRVRQYRTRRSGWRSKWPTR